MSWFLESAKWSTSARCEKSELKSDKGDCREQQKYDCEPPRLEYSRSGPACETGYEEAVTFTDKECKFVQQLGEEYHVVLGGGVKNTEIRFGKQDVEATPDFDVSEILDVIKGLFSDLIDHPESDPAPEAP